MPQYFYQTIRARVRNPYLPVDISTRLPMHLTRITGIQCRYCYGIERLTPAINAEIIPRIGWFTLAANSRKRPLGVFDVRYERAGTDACEDYQELDVPIQGGSMLTGTYNNELQYPYGELQPAGRSSSLILDSAKVRPDDIKIVNPANAANYSGYIVAVYLKCIGEINLKQ